MSGTRTWQDDRLEHVRIRWQQGASAAEIAREIGGVTRNAVLGQIHRRGWAARSVGASPPSQRRAVKVFVERAPKPPKAPKPVLRVINNQQAFEEAPARPPRVAVDQFKPFEALPGSNPKPWDQRGKGCNWPIDDGLSCCEPVAAFGWCSAHVAIGRKPIPPAQKNLARALRWYTS